MSTKIKDYAGFKYQLGKLEGISEVVDSDKLATALMKIGEKLEKMYTKKASEAVIENTLKRKTKLGAVQRPSAEQIAQTPQQKEEEEAMGETLKSLNLKDVYEQNTLPTKPPPKPVASHPSIKKK